MRSISLQYQKNGKVKVVLGPSEKGQWKDRVGYLMAALGGKYTSGGYVMSRKRGRLLVKLAEAGWSTVRTSHIVPDRFIRPDDRMGYTLKEAAILVDLPTVDALCEVLALAKLL